MPDNLFVMKKEIAVGGVNRQMGEIVEPDPSTNFARLFGDNTRYAARFVPAVGTEPILCGTDGCVRKFSTLGALERHRKIVHAPERSPVAKDRREYAEVRQAREARGETLGGYEIEKTITGPKGQKVPYVKLR